MIKTIITIFIIGVLGSCDPNSMSPSPNITLEANIDSYSIDDNFIYIKYNVTNLTDYPAIKHVITFRAITSNAAFQKTFHGESITSLGSVSSEAKMESMGVIWTNVIVDKVDDQ